MPLYTGETVLITHTAEFDGEVLTVEQVAGVFMVITRGTGDELEEILSEREMVWSAEKLRWQYDWDTTDLDPGGYRVKIRLAGFDGSKAHEYKTIRLSRNPV